MGCSCEKLAGQEASLSPVCIGNLWMFKDLAPLEQQMLADRASRRQRTKGQFVFQQGDNSAEMFLLKSGRVKLSKILAKVMFLENKIISLNTGEANGTTDYRYFGKSGEEFEYG